MLWILLAVLVVALGIVIASRRRDVVTVSPSEPITTMNLAQSRKATEDKKAALKAANQMLR
jgi:hypothetical protein